MNKKAEKIYNLIDNWMTSDDRFVSDVNKRKWEGLKEYFLIQMEKIAEKFDLIVTARKNPEFKVFLKDIEMETDEGTIYMGNYLLIFQLEIWSMKWYVKFKQISINDFGRKVMKDAYHPHISGGRPCLGDFRDEYNNMSNEWAMLSLCCKGKEFLECYNRENPYHHLGYYVPIELNLGTEEEPEMMIWKGQNKAEAMFSIVSMYIPGLDSFVLRPDDWPLFSVHIKNIMEEYECNQLRATHIWIKNVSLFFSQLSWKLNDLSRLTTSYSGREKVSRFIANNGNYFGIGRLFPIYLESSMFKTLDRFNRLSYMSNYLERASDILKWTIKTNPDFSDWNKRSALSEKNFEALSIFKTLSNDIIDKAFKSQKDVSQVLNDANYYIRKRYLEFLTSERMKIEDEIIHYSEDGKQNNLFAKQVEVN